MTLLVVADSSDRSQSTRKAPPSFTPGDIWAVEVKRATVPTWRIQSFHKTPEQAELTVPKSLERWGATEAQVIPARCVVAES